MDESSRFGRNFGTVAFAQLFSQILTLIVSLAIARAFGIEQYGVFVFGLAFPSWFLLFVSLGLNSVLTIDVAADQSKARSYLTAIAVVRIPLVLATIAALWIFVTLILSDPLERLITMILGVASILATYATTFRSIFRAFERLEYGALVTFVERSITTAGVLLLVLLGYGLLEVSLVFLLGSVVNLILLMVITRRRFVWFERQVDFSILRGILRKTVPFGLSVAVSTFLYTSGPVLLTILLDSAATGEFNAAFTIAIALVAPLVIYATVILPVLSRMHREGSALLSGVIRRAQKLFFIVGLPAALGGWFYATEIMVLLYGDAFQASGQSFEVVIFTVAVAYAVVGLGPTLAATQHQKLNLLIGGAGASTNVVLCLAWIPIWGPVGAAYAFLVARLVSASLRMTAVTRLVTPVDLRGTLARPLIAGVAMILVLVLLPALPLWLGGPAGASVYFLVLFSIGGLLREDLALIRDALRGAVFR